MRSLPELTIAQASKLLAQKKISSVELTGAVLKRAEKLNPKINAFITITKESALEQAKHADKRIKSGKKIGPLDGIPIAIKDLIVTKGIKTTAGSQILANFVPPYSATVVKKLEAAGVVMVGKTNLDEFGMGSSGETSFFGPTKNPWDLKRVTGGSSSGSAATVASNMCLGALGTDTAGSIRQPAAFCGIVGFKPTYGAVSRFGLIAMTSSLDQIGPMTKTVEDAQILFEAIAAHDPVDSTSFDLKDLGDSRTKDIKKLKIGVVSEYFKDTEPGIAQNVKQAIGTFKKMGGEITEISLPTCRFSLPVYYLVMPVEVSSNLARYDGIKYGLSVGGKDLLDGYLKTRAQGFGDEAKRRIMLGTYASSVGYYDKYYLKAKQVQTVIRKEFEQIFQKVDLLLGPTTPEVAFPLGEKVKDPVKMYLSDILTVPVNIAGLTAISVPCGEHGGLPVGLQIIGRAGGEGQVLRAAAFFEKATAQDNWRKSQPKV